MFFSRPAEPGMMGTDRRGIFFIITALTRLVQTGLGGSGPRGFDCSARPAVVKMTSTRENVAFE
jgi:hypothetical protein